MIVKEKFDLLKGMDNVMRLSAADVKRYSVTDGPHRVFVMIELNKNKIANHYTKEKIFRKLTLLKERNLEVLNLPDYQLPISYNLSTKNMIINISPFGINDLETDKPGPYNTYALMVYAIVFGDLVSGKTKVSESYAPVFSNYFSSIFMRLFGKQYGLLGSFARQIPKMRFLTNLYVLDSFFGIKGLPAYKKAATASAFDYKEISDNLSGYDFSNINYFIKALSDFGVMPNISRHLFAQKLLNFFKLEGMPAFEDCSRLIATIATSDIKGSYVVPTIFSKYNEKEYGKILEISRSIFKKR